MQCWHCEKNINGKSWNHLENIQEVSEDNKLISVEKHICSYGCYKRLRETNILPTNLWNHIVNKEDYKGLISPVIPKKNNEFRLLTHEELKNMDVEDVEKYYQDRDDVIYLDPEKIKIHDELVNEDKRTEYLERDSSGEEYPDDY